MLSCLAALSINAGFKRQHFQVPNHVPRECYISEVNTQHIIALLILLLSYSVLSMTVLGTHANEVNLHEDTIKNGDDWRNKAAIMVKTQIKSRGIQDARVLKAMRNTPRHLFVPKDLRDVAYIDRPLPIGLGQTISQPYIVALMTELLELKGDEKVLEIGTGSGYQAAVLAQLVKEVYSIEIVKPLADSSRALLERLGHENVKVIYGDGYKGLKEQAPFDRIIITAAPPEIPEDLIAQLKPGGIMVLPVGKFYQELVVIEKKRDGTITKRSEGGVRFVPMVKPGKKD